MKKVVMLFALFMLFFAGSTLGAMNYVIIEGKTYFSDEVKMGLSRIKLVTDEGWVLKAPLKKVEACMVEGKVFERVPVVCCNGKFRCMALLELVSTRNGLRLYKMHSCDSALGCVFCDKQNRESIYMVYKDGKLHLRINRENAATVLAFFHLPYRENGYTIRRFVFLRS